MSLRKSVVAAEFARRAKQFHSNEKDPMKITLWGLFSWGAISQHIKAGRVIPNAGFTKINETIWCKPSKEFYESDIKPLLSCSLEELQSRAGWR